jgi:hypothetical protein
MSDGLNYLTVILEQDIREDDAQRLIEAIKCLRGVLEVKPNVADAISVMAQARARRELGDQLWKVLYPERGSSER